MNRLSSLSFAAALAAAPALAQSPAIVADMPVTHSLVSMVLGETGQATLLLDQGADSHDFQLRPSHARALAQAGLVVWMGEGMTPWLESALEGRTVLDLSAAEGVERQDYRDWPLTASNAGGHDDHGHDDHEHDEHGHDEHGHDDHAHDEHGHDDHGHDDHAHDEHGHDDHGHDDHAHDDHAHGDFDPHLWLDPHNARAMISAIADAIAGLDPANADLYRANATAAQARIDALDTELAALLAPAAQTGLVVFHDAYGYFISHYGLTLLGTIAEGDAADPGAQRLARIRENLAHLDATCLFPETGHSDRYPALVAEGTDLRLGAALDPEGRGLEPGSALYSALMRSLAQAIADCANG